MDETVVCMNECLVVPARKNYVYIYYCMICDICEFDINLLTIFHLYTSYNAV